MPIQNLQNNSDEEILIKDEAGNFKILKGDKLLPFVEEKKVVPPAIQPKTMVIDTGMGEPMLQPPPPVVRQKTAAFYFHPEDEEEVARFRLAVGPPTASKLYSLDKIVNKVMETYQLVFNRQLRSRFQSAVFNFLRDRRTLLDFQELLVKSESNGGLNLSVDLTEKVSNFLKEIREKVVAESGLVIDEKESPPAGRESLAQAKSFAQTTGPSSPPRPLPKIESITAPLATAEQPFSQPSTVRFQRPVKRGKISDVKRDYKLYGPVEELGSLDLETFRRLSANTRERVEKVIKKIDSLAHESLTKKSAGIKAWRHSPLSRMYLAIGQASMEHEMAVAEIINQYQTAGREILTLEEFEAVSDINRGLRF